MVIATVVFGTVRTQLDSLSPVVSDGDDGADQDNADARGPAIRAYADGCEAPLHPMTRRARAGDVHRVGACGYAQGVHAGEHDRGVR